MTERSEFFLQDARRREPATAGREKRKRTGRKRRAAGRAVLCGKYSSTLRQVLECSPQSALPSCACRSTPVPVLLRATTETGHGSGALPGGLHALSLSGVHPVKKNRYSTVFQFSTMGRYQLASSDSFCRSALSGLSGLLRRATFLARNDGSRRLKDMRMRSKKR